MKKLISTALVLLILFASIPPMWANEPRQILSQSSEETKFRGTTTDWRCVSLDPIGVVCSWTVEVEEVLFGPSISGQVSVPVNRLFDPCYGYVDPNVDLGDTVEVYGVYDDEYHSTHICESDQYYIIEIVAPPMIERIATVTDYYAIKSPLDIPNLDKPEPKGFDLC